MQLLATQQHGIGQQSEEENTDAPIDDGKILYSKALELLQQSQTAEAISEFIAASNLGHAGAMAQLVIIYSCSREYANHEQAECYKNMAIESLTSTTIQ